MKHFSKIFFIPLVSTLFLLISFYIPLSADRGPEKFALLIGISDYDRGRGKDLDWHDLNCTKDVDAMKKILIEKFDFIPDNILVLKDEKATSEGIKTAFREHLIKNAAPGDTVVFHFSGHGQQIPDDDPDEEIDGKDECLVPCDYEVTGAPSPDEISTNPRIRDDDLEELLGELTEKMNGEGDIFVILDSCHSGTGTKGIAITRGRPWDEKLDGPEPEKSDTRGEEDYEILVSSGNRPDDYIVISACKTKESAYEDPDTNMGVLTENLIKVLEKSGPDTTYNDIYKNLALNIEKDWKQSPRMEGNGNKLLLNGTVKPSDPYLVVKDAYTDENGRLMVILPAGELHGVTEGSVYELYPITGEKEVVALVAITCVDISESVAEVDKEVDIEKLLETKAVERVHNYVCSLKVFIEDSGEWAETLIRELETMNIIRAEKDEGYDIKIYYEPESSQVIMEGAKEGIILARIENDPEILEKEVKKNLLTEWRKRFIMGLSNDEMSVEIRFLKLDIETAPGDPDRIIRERGEPQIIEPDEHNELIIKDEDWLTVEARNLSDESLYITIFCMDASGGYYPVFPVPGTKSYEDIIQGDYNKLLPDGEWHRIPFGAPESYYKKYCWKAGEPFGREILKVIATTDPVDFSPLLDQNTASQIENKGEDEVLKTYITSRGEINPLALLLVDIHEGGTKGLHRPVETSSWATAELIYNAKEK